MKGIILLIVISIVVFQWMSCKSKSCNTYEAWLYGFRKENDTIYYYDEILNVDAATFQVLDEYFCKDNQQVFYHNTYRESSDYFTRKRHYIKRISEAEPESFVILNYGYAKDKNNAWFKERLLNVKDVSSLKAINHHFIKDNIHAYLDGELIPGTNGSSFELMENYAKDNEHYFFLQPVDDSYTVHKIACDVNSFQILEYPFSKDAVHVFYKDEMIAGANPDKFSILGSEYSKDSESVYFRSQKIRDADPLTLELFMENENSMGENVYAKDRNNIYINDKPFPGVDAATFRILDEKYTLDKNGVYYKMKKITGADVISFKVYPHFMGDADAEDKNHKYGEGERVK